MFSGASGFYNAPIVKLVTVSTGLATLLVPSFQLKKPLELVSLEQITQNHQIWRLLSNNFFFSSAFEAMLGIFLLYQFRLFERQMGSSKFAAFVSTTWGVSVLTTLALFVFFNPKSSAIAASGPYPLIFSLLVQYYFEVPATYRFRVLGLNGSNKIIIYLAALQLLGSKMPGSIILALSGIIAGLAYRSDTFPLKRFSIPQSIVKFCSKFILPILQQPRRPIQRNVNMNGQRARGAAGGVAGAGAGAGRERGERERGERERGEFEALPAPAESEITALMDLGFSREAALGALRNANNDTQLAAALLLDPS